MAPSNWSAIWKTEFFFWLHLVHLATSGSKRGLLPFLQSLEVLFFWIFLPFLVLVAVWVPSQHGIQQEEESSGRTRLKRSERLKWWWDTWAIPLDPNSPHAKRRGHDWENPRHHSPYLINSTVDAMHDCCDVCHKQLFWCCLWRMSLKWKGEDQTFAPDGSDCRWLLPS